MKRSLAFTTFALLAGVALIVSPVHADDPSVNEVIVNDADVTSDDTTVQGETSSDGGDAVNVMGPSAGESTVEVRVDPEGYIEVVRANELVERIIAVDDGTCQRANGQIGEVSVCGSNATLSLIGRPQLACPDQSGGVFGPCRHQGS